MTEQAATEYAIAVQHRYGAAGRAEKGRILDEFCATTGMHRKAAIRLLNRKTGPATGRKGRPRRYGPEAAQALVSIWQRGRRGTDQGSDAKERLGGQRIAVSGSWTARHDGMIVLTHQASPGGHRRRTLVVANRP